MQFLSGYKTYIAALGLAVTALGAYHYGLITSDALMAKLFEALGMAGIRSAITTTAAGGK